MVRHGSYRPHFTDEEIVAQRLNNEVGLANKSSYFWPRVLYYCLLACLFVSISLRNM